MNYRISTLQSVNTLSSLSSIAYGRQYHVDMRTMKWMHIIEWKEYILKLNLSSITMHTVKWCPKYHTAYAHRRQIRPVCIDNSVAIRLQNIHSLACQGFKLTHIVHICIICIYHMIKNLSNHVLWTYVRIKGIYNPLLAPSSIFVSSHVETSQDFDTQFVLHMAETSLRTYFHLC